MSNPAFANACVLGNIELTKNKLIASTNSRERAIILEDKLQDELKGMIKEPTWEIKSAQEMMVKSIKDDKAAEPDLSPEEEAEMLVDIMEQYFMEWIDTPLKPLNGKTPKQAAKNPKIRDEVIELMKGYENNTKHLLREKGVEIDTKWMWQELGLEAMMAA